MTRRRRKSPSYRWNREHGPKIVHRFRVQAMMHAHRLNKMNRRGEIKSPHLRGVRHAYACYWTSDYHEGETGRRHYHVGRKPVNPRNKEG